MAAFMRRRVCPLIQLLAVGVAQCKQAPQCVLQPTGACAPDRVALVLPRWPSIPSRPGSACCLDASVLHDASHIGRPPKKEPRRF